MNQREQNHRSEDDKLRQPQKNIMGKRSDQKSYHRYLPKITSNFDEQTPPTRKNPQPVPNQKY